MGRAAGSVKQDGPEWLLGPRRGEAMTKDLDAGKIERDLERLEEIVGALEDGSLSLEGALKIYEEGIGLVRGSRKALDLAGEKVEILSRAEAVASTKAQESPDEESAPEAEQDAGEDD